MAVKKSIQSLVQSKPIPQKNKISVESPIGRGLLGHKENDNVQIETPAGEVNLRILEVS